MSKETDKEKLLKKFSNEIKNLSTSLNSALGLKDTAKSGTLNYVNFKRAITDMKIQLSEPEIKSLFEEGRCPGIQENLLEISLFIEKVKKAQNSQT